MKYKVRDLLERKEAVEAISKRMDGLKHLDSDRTLQTLMIDSDDAACAQAIIEEYGEILDELIGAAEVVF